MSEWDGVERRREQREDAQRILNIERNVIQLQTDFQVTRDAINELANNVSQLVEIRNDFKDLKRDYDYTVVELTQDVEVLREKLSEIEPVIFFAKRPKLTVLILCGMYAMTIKEVRDIVFGILRFT